MAKARYNPRMSTTQQLVANVNRLRQQGIVSVNDLAEKTGLHRVHVSQILNGHQDTITLDTAVSIANAVGFSLDDLVSGPIADIATSS